MPDYAAPHSMRWSVVTDEICRRQTQWKLDTSNNKMNCCYSNKSQVESLRLAWFEMIILDGCLPLHQNNADWILNIYWKNLKHLATFGLLDVLHLQTCNKIVKYD